MTESRKKQARIRKQRQRDKEKAERDANVTESVTKDPDNVTPDVTQYPAYLYALTDPVKRMKLVKIHQSLKEHNVDKLVFSGYPGSGGIPFDTIGELLDATAGELA